jgi:class 3 adenylate cyclase/tetratricopeptide (TPR) repeat protein
MFCDLVGSTNVSSRMDPEDYRDLINGYQAACQRAIGRFEGHVAQQMGDGLLVYFGWPKARENDAARAALSGLEIVSEIAKLNRASGRDGEPRLQVRIGIHTGLVVVGQMDVGDLRDTLAVGETSNLAARIQGVAQAGAVLMSESTAELVGGLFVTDDLGTPVLKGITEPVRVFRVVRQDSTRNRMSTAPRGIPPVGRITERDVLLERFERSARGAGQTVWVRGEAGIGKSTLIRMFREDIQSRPSTWLECSCSPFASNSAFHPMVELLRREIGLRDQDDVTDARARLSTEVVSAGLDANEFVPIVEDLLRPPLGGAYGPAAESPEMVRRKTMDFFVRWVSARAARKPLVLVVEDLHWSDSSTLELLRLIESASAQSSVLCLFTERQESGGGVHDPARTAIVELSRLTERETRALVERASEGALSPELIDRIVERADGIPLFAEELVRSMRRAAVSEADAVPATLKDSLTGRLDELGEAKQIAQLAATLGRRFTYSLLAAVAELDEEQVQFALRRLVDAELLVQDGAPPTATYTFNHALIQDTAYGSQLRSERRQLHRRVASVLESRSSGEPASDPDVLARHWLGAGEHLRGANYLYAAGRRAGSRAAYKEAIAQCRHALSALADAEQGTGRDTCELSLQIMLGNAIMAAAGFAAPDTMPAWERSVTLAGGLGDIAELSSALNGIATYLVMSGQCDEAAKVCDRILDLGQEHNVRIAALRGHSTMAQARFYLGQPEAALTHADTAIALYRSTDFTEVTYGVASDQGVVAHGFAALGLTWLGRLDAALERARACVDLAEGHRSHLSIAMARSFLSVVHAHRGEHAAAVEICDEVTRLSRELGFQFWLGFSMLHGGLEQARIAPDAEGLQRAMEGIGILSQSGAQGGAPHGLAWLAETLAKSGQFEPALQYVQGGLQSAAATGQRYYDSELMRIQGEILLATGKPVEGEDLLHQAVAHARSLGAHGLALKPAVALAYAWADRGERSGARDLLAESLAAIDASSAATSVARARAMLDEMRAA